MKLFKCSIPATLLSRHLAALALFAVLAFIWLSNPLFSGPGQMVSDPNPAVTTDYYHFHWNFWWIRHALTHGLNTYQTNYIFAPFSSSLALHTLAAFWYPIWAALEPLYGTITAMNGIFFAALALNGYIFWAFLKEQGTASGLALAGGILLQGSALMIDSVRWSMVNLLGWFWIPLVIMVWMRLLTSEGKGTVVWSLVLGVTLWAMILTDLQYAIFLAFALLPVVLWSFSRKPGRVLLSGISRAAMAMMIALALLWWTGTLQAVLGFDRGMLATTPADRAPNIAFPLGYLLRLDTGISLGSVVMPIVIVAMMTYFGRRQSRGNAVAPHRLRIPGWVWLAASALPLILSAGDTLPVGSREIALPYTGFHALLGGTFRYPERFANVFIITGLAFALPRLSLALKAFMPFRKGGAQWVPLVLFLACLWDVRVFASVPTRAIPTPYTFYRTMGEEEYDYVVLEVPTAGASGEGIVGRSEWAATQFYGVTHGKRMINGHISRVDPWQFLYMETADPMLAWLGQRRYLDETPVRQQLAERIYAFPIGYIVIHAQWLPQNGPTLQEVLGFLNSQVDLVCPMWIEGDAIVYRTRWHPDSCPARTPPIRNGSYSIDIGTPEDQRFIGWGWHWREVLDAADWRWMGDYPRLGAEIVPEGGFLHSDLFVELPPGAYRVKFSAQSFEVPRAVRLSVDNEVVAEVTVQQGILLEYTLAMRAEGGVMRLRFEYDGTLTPADVGLGTDQRRLSIAVDAIRFEPVGS